MMTPEFTELRLYGEIIADKNHETTEGHFIRFTTYKYEDRYYVVTMFDGDVIFIGEKNLSNFFGKLLDKIN